MKKTMLYTILAITMTLTSIESYGHLNDIKVHAMTDGFKKIDSAELPPPVVEALLKDYPTSRLKEAYKNPQGKYKLIMVLKSGTKRTVYIDAYGRWTTK
ncbi:hypothetical protein ABV409_05710 [Flagellimonas sp. DF-77]|uniref:hypothetical protein n=1 Tax=Flagellimonas algarum TaxID=3230298 RepID=UPI003392CFC8